MEFLRLLLLFVHLLGMGLLVAAFVLQLRTASDGPLVTLWRHGGELQFVTGLALVGLRYPLDLDVDNVKIAIKLAVVLAVLVLAFLHRAKRTERIPSWLTPTLGGLVALNVGVAVFWT